MTSYRFGDILLVPFPFTNQLSSKKRPAVAISSNAYQENRSDIIIMAVTSQLKEPQLFGEVFIYQWKEAGLLKPSVVKPVITTIEKSLVLKKLGALHKKDQVLLLEGLNSILSDSNEIISNANY